MSRPLRLVAWNACGVPSRRAELANFGTEYDLDVILLSETFLTPAASFQLPAYTTYPVSYTHLDVYKRQEYTRKLFKFTGQHVPMYGRFCSAMILDMILFGICAGRLNNIKENTNN